MAKSTFSIVTVAKETFLFFWVFALLFLDNFLSWSLGKYKRPLNLFMRRQFYAFKVLRTELWGLFRGTIQPLPDSDDEDSVQGQPDRRMRDVEDDESQRRHPTAPEPAEEAPTPPSPPNANGPVRRRHPTRNEGSYFDQHPMDLVRENGAELFANLIQFHYGGAANNGDGGAEGVHGGRRHNSPNVEQNGQREQNGNGDEREGDVEVMVEQNGVAVDGERVDEVVEENVNGEGNVEVVEENLNGERIVEQNENANGGRTTEQDEGMLDAEKANVEEKQEQNGEEVDAEKANVEEKQEQNGEEVESKEVGQNGEKVDEGVNGKDESKGEIRKEEGQRDEEKVEGKEETRSAANVENPQGTVEGEKVEEPVGSQANGNQAHGRHHSGGSTNGHNNHNASASPASKSKGKKARTRKPRGGVHQSAPSGRSSGGPGNKRHLSPGEMTSDD